MKATTPLHYIRVENIYLIKLFAAGEHDVAYAFTTTYYMYVAF